MGYDVMAAWEKRSFEFNDDIQERGGSYRGRIAWQSSPGRSISQEDYVAPTFNATTSRWSPPLTPTTPISPTTMFPRTLSPKQTSSCSSPQAASIRSNSSLENSLDSKSLAGKLYAASAAGDIAHMELLISLGAPINSATNVPDLYEAFKPAKAGFLSPLAGAASFGKLEAAMFLVSRGARITPSINTSSSSPLQQACRANDITMTSYLLANGADVNQVNCYKSTPLMYAVKYGSAELVTLILSYRPNLGAVSFMGSSAAHWAIWPGRLDMLELLLRAGADPDDQLADESTLLHCAALIGWVDGVKLLVKYGADPFRRDGENRTPLDIAEANQQDSVTAVLKAAMLLAC